MSLYPLLFAPRLVEKIWGGRKIESVLGKPLPPQKPIGESWEIYDFPPGAVDNSTGWVSSIVANGPLAGQSLHDLVQKCGPQLLGKTPVTAAGQFPILIKYLDAREDLSVQVHPDQAYADANPDAFLKSEAWYVVQNEPGARLLKGLATGATRDDFARAITDGTVENLIQSIKVKPGDCHYLPSGTVHALGAGILAAEVQTPSDTTFRVFDFNRIEEATGKPRKLHVDQAMACIDFDTPDAPASVPNHIAGPHSLVSRLVDCPYFRLEKVRMSEGVTQPLPFNEPVIWMLLQGQLQIKTADLADPVVVKRSDTVLLPAQMNNPVLTTTADCVWLEVTFPG